MKSWFRDDLFKLVLKNAGKLATGKLAGALLGLGALACATHGLVPSDFGVLILVKAYAQMVADVGQFQSWQVVLHYGSIPWQKGETERVKTAIGFSIGLDLYAGFIAMIVGMAILWFLGPSLGVHSSHRYLALFYCTLIPVLSASSDYGILRLFDRIDVVSKQQIISPVVRTILSFVAWLKGMGLFGFVLAWYSGGIASDLYAWVMAWLELRRRNLLVGLRPGIFSVTRDMPKGIWGFVWSTSVNTMLGTIWGPLSNLVIGRMLGTTAAGLYSLASTFIDAVQRPVRLLEKSYYPEVARLDPRTGKPWRLAAKMSLLGGALGLLVLLIVYIGGKPVISLFGHKYGDAATIMLWMAPALLLNMAAFPLYALLYTAGKSKALIIIQFCASALYLPLLIYLGRHYGLNGVGLAFTLGSFLGIVLNFLLAAVTFFRRQAIILPHERVNS
ncbi:lipopolysaccharide biosynthesis protein [Acetobacteraceae bacterium ESL0709]|nr:lipopolysaccharide biosynthesis protein [Acetobacteraceae bacterium ESL0697]MDF7677135.1 lipopolysaccharide biosynthesis protein [Acetobacteraceae bacterium ESL0709]